MSTRGFVLIHRIAPAIIVLAIGCLCAWNWPSVEANVPIADGPRVIRQYVVALMPALLSPVLVDRLPEVSETLARGRRVGLLIRTAFLIGCLLPSAPLWVMHPTPEALYQFTVTCLLVSIVLAFTPQFGVVGTLLATTAGFVWLVAGGGIASVLGFGFLDADAGSWVWVQPAAWVSCAVSVALVACSWDVGRRR